MFRIRSIGKFIILALGAVSLASFCGSGVSAQNLAWTPQRNIAGVGTSIGPSLAVFQNRLFAARKGGGDDAGIYWSESDGNAWSPQLHIAGPSFAGVGTSIGPSLAVFQNRLFAAWKGGGDDAGIYWSSMDFVSSLDWAPQRNIGGVGTSFGPSLAVFQNRLFAAWKGGDGDTGIYWSSFDGNTWTPQRNIGGVGTSFGPSLAVFQNRLFAAWKGGGGDTGIYWSSFDGNTWAPQQNISGVGTSFGPSLAVFQNRLFAAWKGAGGDTGIYFAFAIQP